MRLKNIFIRAAICFAIGVVIGIGIIFLMGDIKEVETRKETIETTEPMNIETEEPTKLEKEMVTTEDCFCDGSIGNIREKSDTFFNGSIKYGKL